MENSSPSPKRRQIIRWGGVSLLAATLVAYVGRGGRTPSPRLVPEAPSLVKNKAQAATTTSFEGLEPVALTDDGLHALLHTEFRLDRVDERPLAGTLIEISETRRLEAPEATYNAFSLFFTMTGDFPEDGAICRITHPQLIPSEIFLTPVGQPVEGRTLLEAAFSFRV